MAELNESLLRKGGDFKSVEEFSSLQKAVCKLEIGDEIGTGFYVNLKIGETFLLGLMTCFHVAEALVLHQPVRGLKAIFNYIHDDGEGNVVVLKPELFLHYEPDLDFIFCGVDTEHLNRLSIEPIPCIVQPPKLEDIFCKQTAGTMVTIFQHPHGKAKHWSTHIVRSVDRPHFRYLADTAPGSSGSPVFAHISGQECMVLVGMHRRGSQNNDHNTGILVDEIMSFLSTKTYTKPMTASNRKDEEHDNGAYGFTTSEILKEYIQLLNSWLASVPGNRIWKKCFHAKTDGWAASTFHQKCDNKPHTVSIIKVGEHVFGGYADVPWEALQKPGSFTRSYSQSAFLYTLRNAYNVEPSILPLISTREQFALYNTYNWLAGYGGIDLQIADNANQNTHSFSILGEVYQLPPTLDVDEAKYFLAGSRDFTLDDIEMFYKEQ